MRVEIKVARDFSSAIGGRYIKDGTMSGERFREDILLPLFNLFPIEKEIYINLDETFGYPSSWLEEVFGGLIRALGRDLLEDEEIIIYSEQDPYLKEEIEEYMSDAVREINKKNNCN